MCLGLDPEDLEDFELIQKNSDDLCDMKKDFVYTKLSGCDEINGVDDVNEFFNMQERLELFNIKNNQ